MFTNRYNCLAIWFVISGLNLINYLFLSINLNTNCLTDHLPCFNNYESP